MLNQQLGQQLNTSREFFDRSTACLEEADSAFRPREEMFSVAEQVASVALTIDWFIEGAFGENGFDMDFAKHLAEIKEVSSLKEARAMLDAATTRATETVSGMSDDELQKPLPDGPIMGGAPRLAVFAAIDDHNAHHRGALTVYSRLLGKVPAMPYMDA